MNKDTRICLGELFALSPVFQFAMTWLSGKPLHDQSLPKLSAWGHFVRAMMSLALGIGLAWLSCLSGILALIPIAWILSLFGMRFMQLVIVHNAAHRNFIRHDYIDRMVGFWVSAVLMIENFESYQRKHGREHHNWKLLSTPKDPTVKSLEKAGIVPGQSMRQILFNLFIALFSPAYHLSEFYQRIRSYWVDTSLYPKVVISFVIICQIGIVIWSDAVWAFTIAWLIPITVLYQHVALLRLVVEHKWDKPGSIRGSREDAMPLTTAIFLGVAPPKKKGLFTWLGWAIQMLNALIVRLTILPGDSGAAHDWHHCHPCGDWSNYLEERRKEALLRPDDYNEVWGYWNALKQSFHSIARENQRFE